MKHLLSIAFLLFVSSCQGQGDPALSFSPRLVGGPCEGCEAVFEYGDQALQAIGTLPGFQDANTQIKVTGTVFQPNGRTPAEGVVLYFYHTNEEGRYEARPEQTGWGRRHGYLRGWVKTGPDGRYTLYTQKPGAYPGRPDPAHIHLTILEPDGKYYWAEDYLFTGDPRLTEKELSPRAPRCGPGLLSLKKESGLLTGKRDLVLGKNIPGYEKGAQH